MEPFIHYKGNRLTAVPAVHYRMAFALEVNRCFTGGGPKPQAVAVETAPAVVTEIRRWLVELGVSPSGTTVLPCMLGLLIRNRLIHPRYRRTALLMEEHFGKPLAQISQEMRYFMLNYPERYLISLSGTDSIIEAIRCSIEYGVPVFGIDMDEFANGPESTARLKDPSAGGFDLASYVNESRDVASRARDDYIDSRRELVMAARLKYLLERYRHVLYTGGLAHWSRILAMLPDPAVKPAETGFSGMTDPAIQRAIIHPLVALRFTDSFPVTTTTWEDIRGHPGDRVRPATAMPDYRLLYREMLDRVNAGYGERLGRGDGPSTTGQGWHRIPGLERLLAMLRLFTRTGVPPLHTLFSTAWAMMPEDYNKLLAEVVMDIRRKWASPAEFPDLPVVGPPHRQQGDEGVAGQQYLTRERIRIDDPAGFSARVERHLDRSWQWGNDQRLIMPGSFLWIWPPCETLLYGMAHRAGIMAAGERKEKESALFEGSLFDGPDIKGSMRACIQGDHRFYVKRSTTRNAPVNGEEGLMEPTVFLFNGENDSPDARWYILYAGNTLGKHVRNRARYEEVVQQFGPAFVSCITMETTCRPPARLKPYIESMAMLSGIVLYGNPCVDSRQSALWVEESNYTCCPVLPGYASYNMKLVDRYYRQHHKIALPKEHWHTAMILMAIPYAREQVIVVAPGRYTLPPLAVREARQRAIRLAYVPLDSFPAKRVQEMKTRFTVRAMDSEGNEFHPGIAAALGQPHDHYRDLLPAYMQKQLRQYHD